MSSSWGESTRERARPIRASDCGGHACTRVGSAPEARRNRRRIRHRPTAPAGSRTAPRRAATGSAARAGATGSARARWAASACPLRPVPPWVPPARGRTGWSARPLGPRAGASAARSGERRLALGGTSATDMRSLRERGRRSRRRQGREGRRGAPRARLPAEIPLDPASPPCRQDRSRAVKGGLTEAFTTPDFSPARPRRRRGARRRRWGRRASAGRRGEGCGARP